MSFPSFDVARQKYREPSRCQMPYYTPVKMERAYRKTIRLSHKASGNKVRDGSKDSNRFDTSFVRQFLTDQ